MARPSETRHHLAQRLQNSADLHVLAAPQATMAVPSPTLQPLQQAKLVLLGEMVSSLAGTLTALPALEFWVRQDTHLI